jgi:hypothetical protein
MLEIEWGGQTFPYCSVGCARKDLMTMSTQPDEFTEDSVIEDDGDGEFMDSEVQDA